MPYGGTRMGDNRDTNVVNRRGLCHERRWTNFIGF
jgi:hypothetical protein